MGRRWDIWSTLDQPGPPEGVEHTAATAEKAARQTFMGGYVSKHGDGVGRWRGQAAAELPTHGQRLHGRQQSHEAQETVWGGLEKTQRVW
jgi:hypothetical protein